MVILSGIAIQNKIYESSASLVYRGVRLQDSRAVIIKLLKQDYPSLQELTRYKQEYEITRSLNLDGVVKAYDQQNYQRTLVILLEDFGGESLEQWMQRQSNFCPMPLLMFLRLAIDLTDILGKIHAAHIIHKDINPGNIVLNLDTGVVKIIDFGIATQFSRTNPTFQSPHTLEGTLAYLSPEQTGRMNRSLDYRTDFYSLGVTFYELLTGQLPFSTTDVLELIHCHIAKLPIPPHELNNTIPEVVSHLVLKLMAKNAEDRYQSAWGIKADLETCFHQIAETGHVDGIQLGLQDVSDQFQIPQKLYGREIEIAKLLAAFDRVLGKGERDSIGQKNRESRENRENQDNSSPVPFSSPTSFSSLSLLSSFHREMILVSGYAGIGKSALVQELYKSITAKCGYFISGKFDQFQRNIPYSAIATALQKLIRQLLGEPDEQVQHWRSRLLTALGNNGQIITDVIPEVELIIGKQPPVSEVGVTEAQNRFNRVFQQFIRVFCSGKHPLVIFLDDLQWVDSATLKLIELMMTDAETQHLFLIGAYRDNEVSLSHPLMMTLEELRKQQVTISHIVLAPLELRAVSDLIAETLHIDDNSIHPLAELVLRKTDGNPFFINEFLKNLYSEGLLRFDAERLSWRWNIAEIESKNITDNVVELLLERLRKSPLATQQILQLAACVGANFSLSTLSIICERSPDEIFPELVTAVQLGVIVPISELDEQLLVQDYQFLHDRVQQAAYVLIDASQKQRVHLQIGRNLLKKIPPEQRSDRLFEIVDRLDQGIELVTDLAERCEIARLNLMAGQKAKAAIAYSAAKKYLAIGRTLLSKASWQTHYELTLELYSETTEVAFLCGDFDAVESWAAIVLQTARTILDMIKVYEIQIQINIAQRKLPEAVNTALQVLQQLGIRFLEKPSQIDIQAELNAIKSHFSNKAIGDLIHLPEMTDPHKLAAMRILSSVTLAARLAASNLMPLLASKQVNLSIQYGNSFASHFAYASYGFALRAVADDIETSYQFGQLALRMLSQTDVDALKAKTLLIVNNFIIHWKGHIREILKPLLEGYQSGLKTGDLEFAAYCAYIHCTHSYFVGKELTEVERSLTAYSEVIRQIKQETVLNWSRIYRQTIANLRGYSTHSCRLIGEFYNEEHELSQQEAANDVTSIFLVYFNKLFLSYLFSEYTQAVTSSAIAERYLIYVTASTLVPLYNFYDALVKLAVYPESSIQVQEEILKTVAIKQEKMEQWARYAPMNCLHKYHLMKAEMARILGEFSEAEEFYEQAIQEAQKNGYLQEESLAYELAAKHYLARGREKIAQTYMKEAHYCYERWGATAKVKDLEIRYPQFFSQPSGEAGSTIHIMAGTTSRSPIVFDLATVMKASQAIASEIELDQLLRSLMQILIENAGAQTGCLILESSGDWLIEAACELHAGESVCTTQVLQAIPIADRTPESIIQYVIRTHKSVILNDATHEGDYINESYIQKNQIRSLLCIPLLKQTKLVGVLYLENQLAIGAFTPDRLQVLYLLSTQAAIAIENAKLYSKLRASESKIAQFLEAVPVGIVVVNPTGRLDYFNQRAIQLLGQGSDPSIAPDQISEAYQLYLVGTDQQYPTEKLPGIRALSGDCTTVDDVEIHQTNATIPVEIWGTPVLDEQGNVAYAIAAFQDITERKQTERLLADYNRTLEQQVAQRTEALQTSEAELRNREQQLRLITDALPVCIFYTDRNQYYRFVNKTCEVWFNCSQEDIIGRHNCEFLDEKAYQRVEPYIQQALAGQITTYEAELSYPFGIKHIRAIYIPDFDANNQVRGYYGLITDISEQRNAALRERQRAEEALLLEERNRMAREIHDTLAQSFTSIIVHLDAVASRLNTDPESARALLKIGRDLARSGLAEARRSVESLRPQMLENRTLFTALQQLAEQMFFHTETQVLFNLVGHISPLESAVESNLLRIGQEALNNALKHARASEIQIEMVYEHFCLILRIRDNGQGFITNSNVTNGFGLLSMTERAERIGAQLTIQSAPGLGTEIIVLVALRDS